MAALILASGSQIRAELLRRCRVPIEVIPALIDEVALKESLSAEDARPRDIADALADGKARKVALKHPQRLVLGCDQVLEVEGRILSKPATPDAALEQLSDLNGKRHSLFSAAVIYADGKPVWRHIGQVRIWMHHLSHAWLQAYVARNWDTIKFCVGSYKLEEEGPLLFSKIEGDHFNVLGLPLLEVLSYLRLRGNLPL